MTFDRLLDRLLALPGLELSRQGEDVLYSGPLPRELLPALRAHKSQLLELLADEEAQRWLIVRQVRRAWGPDSEMVHLLLWLRYEYATEPDCPEDADALIAIASGGPGHSQAEQLRLRLREPHGFTVPTTLSEAS